MSSDSVPTMTSPWTNRWTEPTVEQLLEPLKAGQRQTLETVMRHLDTLDGAQRQLVYYGPAWGWTIEYLVPDSEQEQSQAGDGGKAEGQALCYLVANPEQVFISVPLPEAFLEVLPHQKLARFIRDGIHSAKRAVSISWSSWIPSTAAETNHVADLIERQYRWLTGGSP